MNAIATFSSSQSPHRDGGRFSRYMLELAEYLRQIEQLGDTELAEQASAALWDVILGAEMARRQSA